MADKPADAPTTKPAGLNAADLLATKGKPRKIVPVELPGLGTVYVRSLNGLELDRLEDILHDEKGRFVAENARAKTVCMCACDAAGNPLFPLPADPAGAVAKVAEVGQLDGPTIIQPIYEAGMALNKRRASDAVAEKKD